VASSSATPASSTVVSASERRPPSAGTVVAPPEHAAPAIANEMARARRSTLRRSFHLERPTPIGKRSEREEVLFEILHLLLGQGEREVLVVVLDHRSERGEPPVVEESTLLASEEPAERRRTVAALGRAIRLEGIDPDLLGSVQVPARLGEERLDVAASAI